MFKNLFKKEEAVEEFVSPVTGSVIKIEDVPDPAFSQKMLGDGIAIVPEEGRIVAPVSGKVIQIFPTKHAIGLETENGLEVLIHIGLETVQMKGEGFELHIKESDHVKPGDLLVTFDIDLVKEKAASIITPMVILNGEKVKGLEKLYNNKVISGKTNILVAKL